MRFVAAVGGFLLPFPLLSLVRDMTFTDAVAEGRKSGWRL